MIKTHLKIRPAQIYQDKILPGRLAVAEPLQDLLAGHRRRRGGPGRGVGLVPGAFGGGLGGRHD